MRRIKPVSATWHGCGMDRGRARTAPTPHSTPHSTPLTRRPSTRLSPPAQGAVVTKWAKSRGEHSGELSKAEFRKEVLLLGLASTGCNEADIDRVFNSYDADGGGYMDAEEAAAMIKGLQAEAEAADQQKRAKERAARAMRARATKKAAQAQEPMSEPEAPAPAPVAVEVKSPVATGGEKKKRPKKASDGDGGSPPSSSKRAPSPAPAVTAGLTSLSPAPVKRLDTTLASIQEYFGGETERRYAPSPTGAHEA